MPRLPALPLPLLLLACRPTAPVDLPICPAQQVAADHAAEADTRQLPAEAWFSILLPDFDRRTHTLPDTPRDCARTPLTPPPNALPARPLTADDLSFGTGDPAAQSPELLVWARLTRTTAGTATGPVALIRWTDRGLEVRGIGELHAPARRTRLRLETLPDTSRLLIVEGEACRPDTAPPCPREAVLMPLLNQRFTATTLVEGSQPPREARLRLDERRDVMSTSGTPRHLQIHRRLDLRGSTPEIRAVIRVRDCPADDKCTDYLSIDDARPLERIDQTFVTPEDPWLTLLSTQSAH